MARIVRAIVIAVASLCGFGLVVALAGLPLYVFPPAKEVPESDLLYVIGPATPERLEIARALQGQGVASELLVSVSREGEFSASTLDVCTEAGTRCQTPDPFTTKGEARMLSDYAASRGIGRTVVLTFTPHVARTRYIFEKCYAGEVTVVAVDQNLQLTDWVYQYAYQSAAFVKAWATPCP